MILAFRTHSVLDITKSLWRECDRRAGYSHARWCGPTGGTVGYQYLLIFIKYFNTCQSNTYSVKDCHGISSSNFGKRYDLFVCSEAIFWVISYCVKALGIWGWKCLVCTFSLEMKWDIGEETSICLGCGRSFIGSCPWDWVLRGEGECVPEP